MMTLPLHENGMPSSFLNIPHPMYEEVYQELHTKIALAPPGTVVMLVGPSRAGKTRLARSIADANSRCSQNDQWMPTAWTEASNTINGRFSMKYWSTQLLDQLKHPIYGGARANEDGGYVFKVRKAPTESTQRDILEKTIKARKTRYIFIDEAHHIANSSSPQTASQQLDSLKSLGNTTGAVMIWIGGYDLLTRGFLSAHLSERTHLVHFPRYRETEKDLTAFNGFLDALSKQLPLKPGRSLRDFSDSLYDGTLGVVGALLTWAIWAKAEMATRNDRFLSHKHFGLTRLQIQSEKQAADIRAGESEVAKLTVKLNPKTGAIDQDQSPRPKPFTRKPKRDPFNTSQSTQGGAV